MAAGTAIGAIIGAMKRVGECSSRGSNAGMGACIGLVASSIAALGICLNFSSKLSNLYNKFIEENSNK